MLSAVLFRLNNQPNKPISTLTEGGFRLLNGDYRFDDRRPDARLLSTDSAATFAAAAAAANVAGVWVEIPFRTEHSTAALQDGAFGDARRAYQREDRHRYEGIVIEIDVVIGGDSRTADEPAAVKNAAGYDADNPASDAGWSEPWMEGPEHNEFNITAGYALTKLNNRRDRSRSRGRYKDRLRPA